MWTYQSEKLTGMPGLRFTISLGAKIATFAEVIQGWQTDVTFCTVYNGLLADVPFTAFRWETPPVTANTMTRPFEFVVLNSPGLARYPDPEAFAEHFRRFPDKDVIEFPNLGRDAIMVVPCLKGKPSAYGHLAAFVREAPEPQRNALWQLVGETMNRRVSATPVWLSTAGAGVSWLHVRLDDRPKYYSFGAYRRIV